MCQENTLRVIFMNVLLLLDSRSTKKVSGKYCILWLNNIFQVNWQSLDVESMDFNTNSWSAALA